MGQGINDPNVDRERERSDLCQMTQTDVQYICFVVCYMPGFVHMLFL
jgi:hypothetical protein